MRSLVFVLAAALGLAACEPQERREQPEQTGMTEQQQQQKEQQMEAGKEAYQDVPEKARQALVIADQVEKNPAQLDAALQAEGMDRQEFDELMYDVARDAKLSDAYLAKREGGPGQRPMTQ